MFSHIEISLIMFKNCDSQWECVLLNHSFVCFCFNLKPILKTFYHSNDDLNWVFFHECEIFSSYMIGKMLNYRGVKNHFCFFLLFVNYSGFSVCLSLSVPFSLSLTHTHTCYIGGCTVRIDYVLRKWELMEEKGKATWRRLSCTKFKPLHCYQRGSLV
jgi:hypothetical protein